VIEDASLTTTAVPMRRMHRRARRGPPLADRRL